MNRAALIEAFTRALVAECEHCSGFPYDEGCWDLVHEDQARELYVLAKRLLAAGLVDGEGKPDTDRTDEIEQLLQRFHSTGRGAGDVEDAARWLLDQLCDARAEIAKLRAAIDSTAEDTERYVSDRLADARADAERQSQRADEAHRAREIVLAEWTATIARADAAEARLAAAAEHHYESDGQCASCRDWSDNPADWPCPTAEALGIPAALDSEAVTD